ncbi:hypothetical protein AAG570_003802 [Ranatra chinensis]|uniref:Uncharacterized protein n=1 Tax=Ranatra chinensis TaxID=642074 RepID=A0ABD0YMQ9_9HEMI
MKILANLEVSPTPVTDWTRFVRETPIEEVFALRRLVGLHLSSSSFKCSYRELTYSRVKTYAADFETHKNTLAARPEILLILREFGFSEVQTEEVIVSCPELSRLNCHKSLGAWSGFPFGRENCVHLLANNPHLITLPSARIIAARSVLESHFNGHQILSVLLNSPNVVTESRDMVGLKLNYLFDTLRVSRKVVSNTHAALSHTLHHLQLRHAFLIRAGLYVVPDPKKELQFKNPSLDRIINTDDETFVTRVATGLSLLEYEVFKQVFEREEE